MVSCVVVEKWEVVEVVPGAEDDGGVVESIILMARTEVVLSEMPKRRRASEIWRFAVRQY